MKIFGLTIFLVFGLIQSQNDCDARRMPSQNADQNVSRNMSEANKETRFDRLPDGVQLTDEVREEIKDAKGEISYQIITVREKLKELGARYEGDELVDAAGRQIRFYKPPVRGASQGFEEDREQREQDERELRELEQKYTVIILYVNPLKVV